ncbi:TolC family protein [Curvibacter delicatus]|jgi:outer membrane protein TolC|uniref:TolC family protein n=1 Tax=Curvibacter delicatus TaxID=80879 RepID=UPI000A0056D2|nr:TolC family protein [Curvibacter delicatus]
MFGTFRQNKTRLGLLFLLFISATTPVPAQTAGVPPSATAVARSDGSSPWTLNALIDELKRANPQLRSTQGLARAVQLGVEPVRAPDNPIFSVTQNPVSYNPFAIGTSQGMTWSVSQNLPWPGKKRLGGEIVQAQADVMKAQVEALQIQLVGQLKSSWSSWQQLQQQTRLLRSQIERLDQIKQATQLRYAQNAAAYADNINAQINQAQAKNNLLGVEGQARILVAQINGLIGRSSATPLQLLEDDLSPSRDVPILEGLRSMTLERNPAIKASKYTIQGAQKGVELAELGGRPDFNVSLLFNSAAPPWGFVNNDSYGISLGVTIPLWYARKEKYLVDQAKAQLIAIRDSDDSVRQQALVGVDSAYLQWTQSLDQLKLLEERVLDQARVAYRLSLANYSTGQTGFVDLMNAYTAMNSAEIATMQARSAAIQARVALETVVGSNDDVNMGISK